MKHRPAVLATALALLLPGWRTGDTARTRGDTATITPFLALVLLFINTLTYMRWHL